MTKIQSALFSMQDISYKNFHAALIPNVAKEKIIGVRTPALRKFAKEIAHGHADSKSGDFLGKRRGACGNAVSFNVAAFLKSLPHKYYEENNLHAFLIEQIRDAEKCAAAVDRFLPFVDNWATCDMMRPPAFKKNHAILFEWIQKWISQKEVYAVRFAIGMLMCHFLEEDFSPKFFEMVAAVQSEEYYIKMMQAWYFATALDKQWSAAIRVIEEGRLEPWTHNKAIQKALESRRIPNERKAVLKAMKVGVKNVR